MTQHLSTAHGHKARKRFGQNFLHDQYVIGKIIKAINPKASEALVEIGPGMGALTEPMLEACGKLDVVELDRDLIPILRTKFFNFPEFRIHEGDALKFDFRTLLKPGQRLRIVGNLPYNISTPLLFHLLSYSECIQDMHFMLQREVVQRLAAEPGSTDYGRLSVMVQYSCSVEPLFDVPPHAFEPQPRVVSALVRLLPQPYMHGRALDYRMLERVVREAFGQRRKTLRNALSTVLDAELLHDIGIEPSRRAETLQITEFVAIANAAVCSMECHG